VEKKKDAVISGERCIGLSQFVSVTMSLKFSSDQPFCHGN